jgi:Rho GDP-dissociation inhibitor
VTVLNLTILAPGRPDLLLPIPFADDSTRAFTLKDGSPYSFRFSFTVANNIVSGLKYSHTVWKAGVRGDDSVHTVCLSVSQWFSSREVPTVC